jgi:nucleotide-binding universal stress UspA family protein
MTMTQRAPHALDQQIWEYEQPLPQGVVAAVDDSLESIEAFRMAAEISARRGWRLHVVSVIAPSSTLGPGPDLTGELRKTDSLRLELRISVLKDLIAGNVVGKQASYEVTMGDPARSIVSAAECCGAELIVSGRTDHGQLERFIGNETTLRMMRESNIPVLAVCNATQGLKHVIVATDFSNASVATARVAAELMGGTGTIYLVHVEEPRDVIAGAPSRYGAPSPSDIVTWFRRTSAQLIGTSQLRVEPAVLSGNPVDTLLEFSERTGADMIAAGSHGYSRVERFFLGSVSTELVRRSQLPILVARDQS